MKNYETRPLGTAEKMVWILDRKYILDFAIAAELDGGASVDAWRFAIDTVQKRHPHLSVRIKGDDHATAILSMSPTNYPSGSPGLYGH